MLKFLLIMSIGLLTSCAACKERKMAKEENKTSTAKAAENPTNVVSEERPLREEDLIHIVGTVRVKKDGCPVLIEMVEGDLYSIVYPINLEEKFKVDGKKILFTYLPSRAPMVEGCVAERVIAVSEVRFK